MHIDRPSIRLACAVERPAPRPYPRALWVVLAAGFVVALLSEAIK